MPDRANTKAEGGTWRLIYQPPYDSSALLAFYRKHAAAGVEIGDERRYARSFEIDKRRGVFLVQFSEPNCIDLEVFPAAADSPTLRQRIGQMLDLDSDPEKIAAHLLSAGDRLEKVVSAHPGLRIPSAWDVWETAVRAILGQQVSLQAGVTFASRLVQRLGEPLSQPLHGVTHLFPSPAAVAASDPQAFGLTVRRSASLIRFAQAILLGEVSPTTNGDPAAWCRSLCTLPGIGDWTAQYVAMRALGHRDAFLPGDLVLQRRMNMSTAAELARFAERWKPWRSYAALYIWQEFFDELATSKLT